MLLTGGYKEVVKALKKRFGKPSEVYSEHVRSLMNRESVDDDKDDLIRLAQQLTFHVKGIERCCDGELSLSQYLTATSQMLMKEKLASKWADDTEDMKMPPVLEDLLNFVERRISALGSNPRSKKTSIKPPGSSGHHQHFQSSRPEEKHKLTVYHLHGSKETPRESCPVYVL